MSIMPLYDFRLRFNFPEGYRIDSNDAKLELFVTEQGERIMLLSGNDKRPIKECASPAIIGEQYSTESKAMAAAEKSKRALLYWAVAHRVGIDFGDGKQRSYATKEGISYFQQKYGCTVRNDIHGIDVYEHIKPLKFVSVNVHPQLGKHAPSLVNVFQHEYSKNRRFTQKQLLACEIYTSSFFDISPRSRFITLVTAIEALLKRTKRATAVQDLIDSWLLTAGQAIINEPEKASLKGSLKDLRRQSIGQAGCVLAQRLLPCELFDGKSSADFFKYCYKLRSQLVHNGKLGDSSVDLLQLANKMEEFVNKLLVSIISTNK